MGYIIVTIGFQVWRLEIFIDWSSLEVIIIVYTFHNSWIIHFGIITGLFDIIYLKLLNIFFYIILCNNSVTGLDQINFKIMFY